MTKARIDLIALFLPEPKTGLTSMSRMHLRRMNEITDIERQDATAVSGSQQ